MPGLIVATILSFIFSWNYFLFALVLSGISSKTADRGFVQLHRRGRHQLGHADGGGDRDRHAADRAPLLIQRRLVSGLSFGAVKGLVVGIDQWQPRQDQFHHERRYFTATTASPSSGSAIPDVAPGEVLVRVSRTALCGSDFKLWHKGAEFTAGHEIFGVVEQPGHRLHGRRYAVISRLHCDRCAACRAAIRRCVWKSPA